MTPAARLAAAADLLAEIENAPARPADAVANDFFRARRYAGAADRRDVSDNVWSILRARRRLAWWLPEPTPRLLIATTLLTRGSTLARVSELFSGGYHDPAPLTTAELTALRRVEGHKLEHPDMPQAVRLEVPDWLLPRLSARFADRLEPELRALGEPAPLDLRVNILKATREDARAALAAEGIDARPTPLSPWALRAAGRRPVTSGAAFRAGLVEIQDEGSQIVAALTGAKPGMRVLDWCAGAGGKTLAMAAMMENRGHIVACDVSAPRLDGAVRRLARAGVHNVERHLVTPGDKWAKRRAGSFDRVLIDAPCTGTGTWRRNPDARMRLSEQDLLELTRKQFSILDDACALARPGGRLVYATCSVLREENEEQVSAFLSRHAGFHVIDAAAAWPFPGPPPADVSEGFMALTPARHGTDGFFAAVMERAA